MNANIKATLTISLVLNVLLAGMLLGDVSHHLIGPSPFNLESKIRQLPPPKRILFENIMGAAKQRMDIERTRIDDAKKDAIRILNTEPFNETAYLAQTRHINELHVQMKTHIAESVVNLAKQLTSQEREVLVDIVSHPPFALQIGAMTPAKTGNTSP